MGIALAAENIAGNIEDNSLIAEPRILSLRTVELENLIDVWPEDVDLRLRRVFETGYAVIFEEAHGLLSSLVWLYPAHASPNTTAKRNRFGARVIDSHAVSRAGPELAGGSSRKAHTLTGRSPRPSNRTCAEAARAR